MAETVITAVQSPSSALSPVSGMVGAALTVSSVATDPSLKITVTVCVPTASALSADALMVTTVLPAAAS